MVRAAAVLIGIICFIGCAGPRIGTDWEAPIPVTMEIAGMSGSRLFDLSRLWLARNLYSEKKILEYENRSEFFLIANGTVDYPATGIEAIARTQYTISFRLTEKTADKRVSLTFDALLINVPKDYYLRSKYLFGSEYVGGYSRPPTSPEEYAAVRAAVSGVAERLRRFLEGEATRVK